jgi:hypothetical protein
MMMIVEQLVEWRLAGETEVRGENLPSAILSTTNPTWPDRGSNMDRRGGKPETNRLSYGVAIYLFMALQPLDLGSFFSFLIYTQPVALLGRGISPSQGRYLHTGQQKHRINANTAIHASSEIRTHEPSVWTGQDSSCLRPRDHCDRPLNTYRSEKMFRTRL